MKKINNLPPVYRIFILQVKDFNLKKNPKKLQIHWEQEDGRKNNLIQQSQVNLMH